MQAFMVGMSDMGKLPGNTESLLDMHMFNGWKQNFLVPRTPLNIEKVCAAKILMSCGQKGTLCSEEHWFIFLWLTMTGIFFSRLYISS